MKHVLRLGCAESTQHWQPLPPFTTPGEGLTPGLAEIDLSLPLNRSGFEPSHGTSLH